MDYWAETMQDDCYLIAADGWKAGAQPARSSGEEQGGQDSLARGARLQEGQAPLQVRPCSGAILIARYFAAERDAIEAIEAELADHRAAARRNRGRSKAARKDCLAKSSKAKGKQKQGQSVKARLKEIGKDPDYADERKALEGLRSPCSTSRRTRKAS